MGQRASFRVDRSGGLYQNNTVVDYITKRRGNKDAKTMFRKRIYSQACLTFCHLQDNLLKLLMNSSSSLYTNNKCLLSIEQNLQAVLIHDDDVEKVAVSYKNVLKILMTFSVLGGINSEKEVNWQILQASLCEW